MAGVLTLSPAASPFPWAAAATVTYTGKAILNFDTAAPGLSLEFDGSKITAEDEVVRTLAKAGGMAEDSAKVFLIWMYMCIHLTLAMQASAYFALAKSLPTATAFPEITAALDSLDDHLAYRTFLVGHEVTAADLIVWGALKGALAP